MIIHYSTDPDLAPAVVRDFFCTHATWKVPTDADSWAEMLRNSCAVVSAWDGERLVGFARGLGDGVRYRHVVDVLVHPDYRGQGIGAEVLRRLVDCPAMRVRGVVLGTPDQREFYESVGFQCLNERASPMVLVRDELGPELVQPVEPGSVQDSPPTGR